MKVSLVAGISCFTGCWLVFCMPAHGLDFRDFSGEWRVEWQQNAQRKNYWLRTPGITLPPWHAAGSLLGEVRGEWHPRLRYNFRGEANFQESEEQSIHQFRLIEGALHYEINPLVFLDVGKVLEEWGTGYAFNPVNLLLPPGNPSHPDGNRPGVTLLKLELLGERTTFSIILAGVADENTAEQAFVIPDSKNKRRVAFKWDHTIGDLDLSWIHAQGGIEGNSLQDYLRGSPLAPQTLPALSGLAWTTVLGESLEIHGEYALQRGRGRPIALMATPPLTEESTLGNPSRFIYQYDNADKDRLFSQFLIGGQFTFGNGFNLSSEWLYHEPGYTRQEWRRIRQGIQTARIAQKENSTRIAGSDPYSGFLSQTRLLLKRSPFRQNYVFLRLFSDRFASDYESESVVLFNADDSGFLFRERLSHFRGAHWTLSLEWTTFQGPAFSEFALNPHRNQLDLTISYLF